MQVLSDANRPYIIDSLTAPMGVSHCWMFSSHMMDFKLEKMEYLEEIIGPTVTLRVQNLELSLPASWQIMIVDKETWTVDTIPVVQCASFNQDVLLFSPDNSKPITGKAVVLSYQKSGVIVSPEIPKGSAIIHPTGPELSHGRQVFCGIVTGPHDLGRWVSGKTVGDILS